MPVVKLTYFLSLMGRIDSTVDFDMNNSTVELGAKLGVKYPCIEFVATKVSVPFVDEKTREKYQDVTSKDVSNLKIDPFPPMDPVQQFF